jgi:hypothetical protein
MTDTTTTPLTGRALWKATPGHLTYDVLVHDSEAFACAIVDNLATHEFAPLTGDTFGGEVRKTYDAHRKALYAYLDAHDVDPELRKLIDDVEDQVYDLAGVTFDQGMDFGKVVEEFRKGLRELTTADTE